MAGIPHDCRDAGPEAGSVDCNRHREPSKGPEPIFLTPIKSLHNFDESFKALRSGMLFLFDVS